MTPIPFMVHCRIEELDAPDATARLAVDAVDPLTNRRGEVHGGLLMTMLDIALGKACQKVSEGATSFVTIDPNVAFLAPGSGRIVAEGRVLRAAVSAARASRACRTRSAAAGRAGRSSPSKAIRPVTVVQAASASARRNTSVPPT